MQKITLLFSSLVAASIVQAGVADKASLGFEAGTMGLGLNYSKKLSSVSDKLVLKLSAAGLNYSTDYDDTDVHYDADLKLANAGLTLDFHPFDGGFYLSAGAYYNGNKIDFKATPTNGTYTFNGNTYNASDIGYVKGETNFNKFAPYLGIGYDRSLFGDGNFFISTKIGAMYQGSPDVDLTGVCGPAIDGTATCVQLLQDIEAEERSLNNDIDKYKWWPVLTIGITYRF